MTNNNSLNPSHFTVNPVLQEQVGIYANFLARLNEAKGGRKNLELDNILIEAKRLLAEIRLTANETVMGLNTANLNINKAWHKLSHESSLICAEIIISATQEIISHNQQLQIEMEKLKAIAQEAVDKQNFWQAVAKDFEAELLANDYTPDKPKPTPKPKKDKPAKQKKRRIFDDEE